MVDFPEGVAPCVPVLGFVVPAELPGRGDVERVGVPDEDADADGDADGEGDGAADAAAAGAGCAGISIAGASA
ncbi:hypothetical protein CG736_04970 [Kitasatospora sp. CB02891]|nr:hypothetical protein CG736_04970 [Kitasatospora sp. CB02891]